MKAGVLGACLLALLFPWRLRAGEAAAPAPFFQDGKWGFVDAQGLVTDSLPGAAPDLVVVTPSHQYPLGGSLPVDRRLALLAWAGRHGVRVVEDDYDSELRYTSDPDPRVVG